MNDHTKRQAIKILGEQMRYLNRYIYERSLDGKPVGLAQEQYNRYSDAFLELVRAP